MNTQDSMEDTLWNFIDGSATAEEKAIISKLIASDQEWSEKYNELLELHQLMQDSIAFEGPSMRFTQNVMDDIAKSQLALATKNYINGKIIIVIIFFFLLGFVSLIIYGAGQFNWSGSGGSTLPVDLSIVHIDYSKIFNSAYINVFIMINIVLAFMLLDMYLTKKKKAYQGASSNS